MPLCWWVFKFWAVLRGGCTALFVSSDISPFTLLNDNLKLQASLSLLNVLITFSPFFTINKYMRKYSRLGVGNHGLNAGAALASCFQY